MHPTPYEKQLDSLAREAARAGDLSTLERITTMLALVRSGQYGTLQGHFPFLHPTWRTRLGAPPTTRSEDDASGSSTRPR